MSDNSNDLVFTWRDTDGEVVITGVEDRNAVHGTIVIPDAVDGRNVVGIDDGAYGRSHGLGFVGPSAQACLFHPERPFGSRGCGGTRACMCGRVRL